MINSNAEKKRKRDAEKRKNAFNMKKYERIIAAEANYDTIVYNGITILMEDDGYAFDFVSQLLKKTYTHLNFDLMGAHGEGGMHHIISYINTDFLILIYDKSNNIKMLQNINTEIREFKNRNSNARVISIMPKVFEEILLSYIYLQDLIKTTDKQGIALMNMIKEYVTGKVADYSLANFIINPERVNDDMILEDWIEKLTVNTQYSCTHSPSKISSCWLNDCTSCSDISNNCRIITPTAIKNYKAKSKIEYIAVNSLGFYITKAIDEFIGVKYRTTNCNLINEKNIMEEK